MSAADGRGLHLIAELRECALMVGPAEVEELLRSAAAAGHATLLSVHAHEFTGGGVAAVALLAESHISLHTWPEFRYVAVDVFMCGDDADPESALTAIAAAVGAGTVAVQKICRQAVTEAPTDDRSLDSEI